MPEKIRRSICAAGVAAGLLALAACDSPPHSQLGPAAGTSPAATAPASSSAANGGSEAGTSSTGAASASATASATASEAPGTFTISFAGDVHFADRTAARLTADPATAFGRSAAVLSKADLTMVNLETAIAVGGIPQGKTFTFQAPPAAFTALKDAGVDVATMANNHGADYGSAGLAQTLAAIRSTGFPVVGIGADASAAYAPYYTTVHGVRLAIVAASQVQDETLANFSATADSSGIASAFSDRLLASVRAAKAKADVVIAYIHWGTEYQSCPNSDQHDLADRLAAAGVAAVIGTHAHVLQGAGWRPDGTYVAYGLGNYFWWRSFGNAQDDNGVLTLTIAQGKVRDADFSPSRLDDTGVSPPATGAVARTIQSELTQATRCADLSSTRP